MRTIYSTFTSLVFLMVCCSPSFAAVVVPTVVTASTVPAAATGVALNTTVSVTFSTAMTAASITTSSFYIKDSAGNQVATNAPVASNSNKTFTITPTVNLSPCGTYTIIVTTSVQSNSSPKGNLAAQYSKSFQTITDTAAPTVTGRVPAVGALGVVESNPVTVTFSKLMDTSTIDATTFGLDNGATGNITFTTASNVTTAVFTPSPNLVGSTLYTATVGTGVKSSCGVALAAPYPWQFTTRDVAAPYVTSTVPSNGAVKISKNSPITINFSEAMQALTTANISVTDGTTAVTGTVSFDSTSNLTATFTPTSAISYNTLYTVTVTGAKDLAGNNLAPTPYTFSYTTVAEEIVTYCNIPPFVSNNVTKPNVLLIMDNSNSMDEDFDGAAVGSYSPNSKSVNGKNALRTVVQQYADSLRMGLMTYNLPSANTNYLNNSPYFVSYEPKSYCPTPPAECADYCETGNTGSQAICRSECRLQNAVFDETYLDEVITVQGAGARRTKYCGLVFPKTKRMINPSDPTRFVYYKQALPFYSGSAVGNEFDFAQTYTATQEITNTSTSTDTYNRCSGKTGTNDTYPTNFTGCNSTAKFTLTDSDLALGYGNIGRRMTSVGVGPTYFANSSPGGGYLQIPIGSNDLVNTQKNKLLNKLVSYSGDQTGYMTCTSGDKNTCSYIVNAGLTPTAGTLQTARDYFTGTSSPIQQRCQKNFIIYVTDGLPSVNKSGTIASSDTLIGSDVAPASGTVLNEIDLLRAVSKTLGTTTNTFDIQTYVLGLGLVPQAKAKLELMADHGGTNQAYYADNPSQLNSALDGIFRDILSQVSSGTSASIVNNRGQSGANLFQAVFYPKKNISGIDMQWIGEMQNLWYYLDPLIGASSIREDTNLDKKLDLKADDKVTVDYDSLTNQTLARWYKDTSGLGTFVPDPSGNARIPAGNADNIRPLWRAGALLHARSAGSRNIYTALGSYNSYYITDVADSSSVFHKTPSTSLSGLSLFNKANVLSLNGLMNISDTTTAGNVIDYVRGVDYTTNSAYRNRSVTINYAATNADGTANSAPLNATVPATGAAAGVGVWKLGDIVSSTPQAQTSKQLQNYNDSYMDNSYSLFFGSYDYSVRNMVYAGANDGMMHAFRIGQVTRTPYDSSSPYQIAKLSNLDNTLNVGDEEWAYIPSNALPYLKYLSDPKYNHLYYVNNTVTLVDVSINSPVATCSQATYWNCTKKTTYSNATSKTINTDETSWRTVLIGGMGLGGASRDASGFCKKTDGSVPASSAQEDRLDCVKSPIAGSGLSSFFALDVTKPDTPLFMWEFSDAVLPAADKGLGFSTSGPAIVRVSARTPGSDDHGAADLTKNGRWFAVFATGPSGKIDTSVNQFRGRSDNRLKVYVVDIHPDLSSGWVKGTNYWVFDSGIDNAFAGDITDTVVDVDRWNKSSPHITVMTSSISATHGRELQ
jgi:methionine-rich copper-binding protein CopC